MAGQRRERQRADVSPTASWRHLAKRSVEVVRTEGWGSLWRRARQRLSSRRGFVPANAESGPGGEDSGKGVTARLWGRVAREKAASDEWQELYWQSHPLTVRHINRCISGDPNEGWLAFTKRRFVPQELAYGLSLGCGYGIVEREGIGLGLCERFDAYDVSEEAVAVARREAERAGLGDRIAYAAADLNEVALERSKYDIVVAASVLHHIEKPERLLEQIKGSLKPGGLLVVNDYVGPSRFQWSEKAEELMNALLAALPEAMRVSLKGGGIKGTMVRPSQEAVIAEDPSEAVRSEEIVRLLTERFEVVYRADFGGTLLHFLLADVAGNFKEGDVKDVAIIDLLSIYEKTLIDEGVLASDFTYMVLKGRRKSIAK